MKDFRQLAVWEKAHKLAVAIYHATKTFPKDEIYGMISQLRRASTSISANIAEGCGGGGDSEFRRYLQIAMRSASELEYHLLYAQDVGLLNESSYREFTSNVTEVKRMLASLIKKLNAES